MLAVIIFIVVYLHVRTFLIKINSFYNSDDLPKTRLKKTVTESLKKALLKWKEQEKDKPAASDGKYVYM